MATIQERLRDNWLDANYEAADTIDALVAALDKARAWIDESDVQHGVGPILATCDAALALARGEA